MTTTPLRIAFTLSGRPMANVGVRLPGVDALLTTDAAGVLTVALPAGRIDGVVIFGDEPLPFTFVNASGRGDVRIDLRETETPIDDERVLAAMPADRYVPIKLLGRGAAGAVYKVRDTMLDRLVAMKLLSEEFASSEDEFDAFLGEARSLARIDHPNLLDIYDLGRHRGRVWMAVEFVDGPDLETLIGTHTRLPSSAVSAAGVQLMRALHALHREGFIHRDVKPSNGLVSRDGRVRLADFGLVRPMVDFTDPRSRIFGTPAYMSPEQLQARPLGPASDIYGLGATLFHMASGQLPFDGPNPILGHLTEPAPDLTTIVPDSDPELATVLLAMLDKDPDARPHVDEVIDRLVAVSITGSVSEEIDYLPRLHTSETGAAPRVSRAVAAVEPSAVNTVGRVVAPGAVSAAPIVSVDAVPIADIESRARGSRRAAWMAVVALICVVVAGIVLVVARAGSDDTTDGSDPTTSPPVVSDEQPTAPLQNEAAAPAANEESGAEADTAVVVALAWRDIGAGVSAAETVARLAGREPAQIADPATVPANDPEPTRTGDPARVGTSPGSTESAAPSRVPVGNTQVIDAPAAVAAPGSSDAPGADDQAPSTSVAAPTGLDAAAQDAASTPASEGVVDATAPRDEPAETDSGQDSTSSGNATPTATAIERPSPGGDSSVAATDEDVAEDEGATEPSEDEDETGRGRRGRQGSVRPPVTF